MCALKRMGLGFTNAPAVQQAAMVASLRAYRRRLRRLGLHTAGTDPGFGLGRSGGTCTARREADTS